MLRKNREGFTLIELLIVVVIIGILAAIALPKFGQTRERAYVSAMQSDLRNLQSAQEMYYAENFTYGSTDELTTDNLLEKSAGVTLETTPAYPNTEGVNQGYTATASHASTDQVCTVEVTPDGNTPITCGAS